MNVLELMATLGLDTTEFDTNLTATIGDVEELSEKTETLTNPTLGGTQQTVLQPIVDDAKSAGDQLDEVKTKADDTSVVMQGFLSATAEIVQKVIEGIIEFGKQSIEVAASMGGELADAYNQSVEDVDLSLNVLKAKAGETLLPISTWFNNFISDITGSKADEKLNYLANGLQRLAETNLSEVQEQVRGMFGVLDEVGDVEVGNVEDYTKNLEEQTEYWQNYADTLNSLKEKGIDPEFLASIADGSEESLGKLQALDAADTESLQTMMSAYESTKAAQDAAAESMNALTLAASENAKAIADAMAPLLVDWTTLSDGTVAPSFLKYTVDQLAQDYPALESIVNTINAKLMEIGYNNGMDNPLGLSGLHGEDNGSGGNAIAVTVEASLSDTSEDNLQGAVDNMELEGEALVYADPTSGSKIQAYLDTLNLTAVVTLTVDDSKLGIYKSSGSKRAVGLDYVPYDEYPATLHEGEAVLTKLEANRWRSGEGHESSGGDVYNVPVTVYGKADSDAIADAVVETLQNMRWMA